MKGVIFALFVPVGDTPNIKKLQIDSMDSILHHMI